MSRPPAPSLRPVRNVVATAIGLAVLGRLLVGAGGPGVFGIVVEGIIIIDKAQHRELEYETRNCPH